MPPAIHNVLIGNVSRTTFLTTLLPLSFLSFFATTIGAAFLFEGKYDWRTDVISILISPRDNPNGYWLPSLGLTAAVIFIWPFAGYVGLHLKYVMPRIARFTSSAFSLSFVLILLSLGAPHIQPLIGIYSLHEFLARAAAATFAAAMLCCSAASVIDWLPAFGGRRQLKSSLVASWATLTVLPITVVILLGILVLLGKKADQAWAENFRQSFRNTPLWRLAFWEWVGTVGVFAFFTASVSFLPCGMAAFKRCQETSARKSLDGSNGSSGRA